LVVVLFVALLRVVDLDADDVDRERERRADLRLFPPKPAAICLRDSLRRVRVTLFRRGLAIRVIFLATGNVISFLLTDRSTSADAGL